MIGILLVTHGKIGASLVAAAEYILGPQECLSAVTVDSASLPVSAKHIKEAITDMACDGGTVILTDMYGGTPSNAGLSLLDNVNVEIVAGVNLPMLMKCLTSREATTPAQLAQRALEAGQRGILVTRTILDMAPPQ